MALSGHPPPETARPLLGVKQTLPNAFMSTRPSYSLNRDD